MKRLSRRQQRMIDLEDQVAALRFSEREWHSKAQDKIAEVERLEVENESLRRDLADARDEIRDVARLAAGND
jgi:regulator of replication initiation timing